MKIIKVDPVERLNVGATVEPPDTETPRRLLTELETLRCRLEVIRHDIGSMGDYLDRGRPDPDEVKKTQELIERQKEIAVALEEQLVAMVGACRQNQPQVIDEWVDAWQAICRELNTYFEAYQDEDVYAYRLERHVTAKAIEEWEKVRSGALDFVINNGYVMGGKQEVVHKHFGS